MGFNFLLGLLIAAMSGAGLFGVISLMIVNASVFHIITGLGTDSSILWHGASNKFDLDKLFTFTFFSALFQIVLFVAISIIFYETTGKTLLSSQQSFNYFYFELIYFCGLALTDKYVSVMYAEQRAGLCNRVLSFAAFSGLLFVSLVYLHVINIKPDPLKIFCITAFAQPVSLILFYHFKKSVTFSKHFSADDVRSFIAFSFIVFLSNLIQFLAYRVDYWFIDHFKNTEQVGIYAQANRFAQLLWIIPGIIAALLEPAIANPVNRMNEKQFTFIARIMNYFNLLLVGAVIIFALFFYRYFLPDIFSDGFRSLLFMLPGFYFLTIPIIFAAYFSGKRLLWINFSGSVLCLLIIGVADILLIPQFGINGAAIANTIAYSATAIFHIIMFTRTNGIKTIELFQLKKDDWKEITKLLFRNAG